ncbi:hypothetical protein [Schaalia hyovaginalis]|uniref:hypothetical protein n=1 Tax=Schaalia hyovaginalis TaxID=29316 RepID=UPI0012B1A238|nr:hypothetical protein [Schaalia hyovaginalis]MST63803.1 hypothetical protein [Schaalia hyovaginalis]
MPLNDAIETLEDALRFHHFSPAFPERMHISKALLREGCGSVHLRTLAAPIYITDLGIRRITDPSAFYREHCKIATVSPISDKEIIKNIQKTPIDRLKATLDATILFFGNYNAASVAIRLRKEELGETEDPELLSACGTICAAMRKPGSHQFFEKAASVATNFQDSYIYNHRLAATLIKRDHRIDLATEILDKQLTTCKQVENSEKELALLLNLKALAVLTQTGHISEAMKLINSSLKALEQAIKNPTYDSDALSRIYRYRSQIHINKAQLLLKLTKSKEAIALLKDNLFYTTKHSPEYVGEAAASLALTYYLSGDYASAIHTSEYAGAKLSRIGSISALNEMRKVIVASYTQLRDTQRAHTVLQLLRSDPLGLAFLESDSL